MNLESKLGYLAKIRNLLGDWVVYKAIDSGTTKQKLYLVNESNHSARAINVSINDEVPFSVLDYGLSKSYSTDFAKTALYCEAKRISRPELSDPYTALNSSTIIPLPHQLSAVYDILLPMNPIRFLLADDPGAGKTIMSGLLICELIARRRISNALIVSPGGLAQQWQGELKSKFSLEFGLFDSRECQNDESYFKKNPWLISKLDILSRSEALIDILKRQHFDLVIIDEAHKLSATTFGGAAKYTKRFKLGQLLSSVSENLLLLTATPHDGKPDDFRMLMSLVDKERFQEKGPALLQKDLTGAIRRVVKEDMVTFDGKKLFPERRSAQCLYELNGEELEFYDNLTEYIRKQFNLAQRLSGNKRTCIGFVMTLLQRRMASSPLAIYLTLKRRLERLTVEKESFKKEGFDNSRFSLKLYDAAIDDDFDDPDEEDDVSETAASTIEELSEEIAALDTLVSEAEKIVSKHVDTKWSSLSKLLQDQFIRPDEDGKCKKIIIFTEYADTLRYLDELITSVLGLGRVVTIEGGMNEKQRRSVQDQFWNNPNVQVLLGTDAADEGINLQCAHYLINYDLPWNPNRLEQRFGRIHRIGQKETCIMFNMISENTREGQVFKTLMKKVEEERKALGNQVYNVIGDMKFDGKTLEEVLKEITLTGKLNPAHMSIDDNDLKQSIKENTALDTSVSLENANEILTSVREKQPDKIQPFIIRDFMIQAFSWYGTSIRQKEEGIYQIDEIPVSIALEGKDDIKKQYDAICFDPSKADEETEFLGVSHPLVKATCQAILNSVKGKEISSVCVSAKRGAEAFQLVHYDSYKLISSEQNGLVATKRTIKSFADFESINEDAIQKMDVSPYLDYSSTDSSKGPDLALALSKNIEKIKAMEASYLGLKKAKQIASINRGKEEFDKQRKTTLEQKRKGLEQSINSLNFQIFTLSNKSNRTEEDGYKIDEAKRRLDTLTADLNRIKKSIEAVGEYSVEEDKISPSFLVLSESFYQTSIGKELAGEAKKDLDENLAMKAVLLIERESDYTPLDNSKIRGTGFDVISLKKGTTNVFRRIEVKGIGEDSNSVHCTCNEINKGLNDPDDFVLAVAKVNNDKIYVEYIANPFQNLAKSMSSNTLSTDVMVVEFKLSALESAGNILLRRKLNREGENVYA